jgi:putative ABC transport system permease protein
MSRRPDLDGLDDEIRDHLDAEIAENLARGMSADDARTAALRKFGNITRVKEQVREVWSPRWIDALRQDLRDAFRQLRRSPALAAAIVATLTLGIGLTTTIFSVVNAVLIRPLAFPNADRVVWLTTRAPTSPNDEMNSIVFAEWHAASRSFEQMVAYGFSDSTMVLAGQGTRIRIVNASQGFWQATGAEPFLGALPAAHEREIIVLAHRTWRDRFAGDPAIVGAAISIDGRPAVIGGVLPEDFAPQLPAPSFRPGLEQSAPDAYRGWVVPPAPPVITRATAVQAFLAFGVLKSDVSVEQARTELESLHERNERARAHLLPGGARQPAVTPLGEKLVGASRHALQLLLVAAAVVLVITCVNVSHLLLSRSSARQKEIALRMSVGSGPLRVLRQLLVESIAFSVLGAIGGVLLASWLVSVVVEVIGNSVPRLSETGVDVTVLAFAMSIAIATAVLFGLGPAISLIRTRVQDVLKEGARTVSASRRVLAAGRLMMITQVALTVVLLVAAGLMVKSVARLTAHPPGFAPDRILTLRVDFRGPQYRDERIRREYARNLLAAARAVPGVIEAALTTGRETFMVVIKEGQPIPENPREHESAVSVVSANLGPMLGMTLVDGRWLDEEDTPGAIVINDAFARQEFPGGNAIGQRIRLPWFKEDRFGTIVGVMSDRKYLRLDQEVTPEVFVHHADAPMFGTMLLLQFDGDPETAVPTTLKALSAVDSTQSFFSIRTLETALSESIAPRRFNLLLLGTFAISALCLAALGVYGVIAYAVSERRHEIGIRLALGAARGSVVRMIVRQGMVGVGSGIMAGIVAALAASRLIDSLLYGVEATDLSTFAVATSLLVAVALIACGVPAARAAAVDPVTALRAE